MIEVPYGAVLVLGGARSGKSGFAEQLVSQTGLTRHYLATGRAWDDEMTARIAAHHKQRGPDWLTHEEPVRLVETLVKIDDPANVVLIDCLTLWITNLMMDEADMAAEFHRLAIHVADAKARLVFVSNEVGLGIVPDNKMAREFRDHAGKLHEMISVLADEVYFLVAGLPLKMKG